MISATTPATRCLRALAESADTRADARACWAGAAALLELHRRSFGMSYLTHRATIAREILALWRLAGNEVNEQRFAEELRGERGGLGVLSAEERPGSSA